MTSIPAAAIVVGVDGSRASLHALDWAAREAAARHRPLRIVHAFQWPLTNELMGPPAVGPPDAGLQHAAERVLAAAADRARAAAPTLAVSTDLPAEIPAAALIEASHDADLLVVGNRGLGGFTGLLLGSVGVQTAAHAACPVIVIRDNDRVPLPYRQDMRAPVDHPRLPRSSGGRRRWGHRVDPRLRRGCCAAALVEAPPSQHAIAVKARADNPRARAAQATASPMRPGSVSWSIDGS